MTTIERVRSGGSTRVWVAGSALVFVLAWLVGLVFSFGGPGLNDNVSEIAGYYADHRAAAMFGTYLIDGVAGAALLVFSAALAGALRRSSGDDGTIGRVALAGGTAAGAVSFFQAAVGIVLANHVAAAGEPVVTRALFDLLNTADTFKMLGLAVLVGAVSVVAFRTSALPGWLGWVGLATVFALVVGGLSFPTNSGGLYRVLFVGLPLLLVWVASVGVLLARRQTPAGA